MVSAKARHDWVRTADGHRLDLGNDFASVIPMGGHWWWAAYKACRRVGDGPCESAAEGMQKASDALGWAP